MRKSMAVFIALAVLAAGGAAWAATTTVAVSASVVGTCQFNNTGSIPFGTLNQVTAPQVTPIVNQPTFWCTKNSAYTITHDAGLNPVMTGATVGNTDTIPYNFDIGTSSGNGAGKSAPITMTIAASIDAGTYSDVSADTYGHTVTLTINP
ncbi:spore coat protein U domain-containing protein [Candidatus Deferrimicrobium sp.]|jgi:spore coat protein U-like protein|uniref:spore coat protein U domain-containing protein n=1 Tax=Candidatus Deferrimicrobium sp. TaxID=3060586 RepID=UPI002ED885E4